MRLIKPSIEILEQGSGIQGIYKQIEKAGRTPQEAREVLPLCTKTELIMTGTIEQWKGFFKLRSPLYGATGAHPQAAELADKLYIQFREKNYI
jgi:thymidylate synthase (FAD)